jgi:hypothetical protein
MGDARSGAALQAAVTGGKITGAHPEQLRGEQPLGQTAGQEILARPGHHGAGPFQFSPFQEPAGSAFQLRTCRGRILPGCAKGRAGTHNKL